MLIANPMLKVATAALLLSAAAAAQQAKASPAPVNPQQAVVTQYCVGCHNTKLKTAGVALDSLDISKVADDAATWEKVLRKVSAHQMPPAGMPHPKPEAEKSFTTYLETELDRSAAAHPNPGHPTIHRLNRSEYSNAIRDLLALDINPGSNLPPDDSGYGFDNIGDVLSLSPVLIERYVSVGRNVSRLAVGDTELKPQVDVFTPVREVRAASKGGPRIPRNERVADDLPFDSAGGLSVQYTFPVDAEYTFKIKMPPTAPANPNATEVPPPNVLELKIPVKAGIRQVAVTFTRSSAVPEILPVLAAGRGGGGGGGRGAAGPAPLMTHMDVRLDGVRLKLYDIPEPPNGSPTFTELSIAGPYDIAGTWRFSEPQQDLHLQTRISETGRRLCGQNPHGFGQARVSAAVHGAGFEATDGLLSGWPERRLVSITGLKWPCAPFSSRRIFCSASSTIRLQRRRRSVHRVNDYELASRLSFFLWSSIPDDELLNLASRRQAEGSESG